MRQCFIGLVMLSGGLGCSVSSTPWVQPSSPASKATVPWYQQSSSSHTSSVQSVTTSGQSYSAKSEDPDKGPAPGGITWAEWKDLQHIKCVEDNALRMTQWEKLQAAREDIRTQCKKMGRDMTMSPDPDSVNAHDHFERDDNGHIVYVEAYRNYIRIDAQYSCPTTMDAYHLEVAKNWMHHSPESVGQQDCDAFYRP